MMTRQHAEHNISARHAVQIVFTLSQSLFFVWLCLLVCAMMRVFLVSESQDPNPRSGALGAVDTVLQRVRLAGAMCRRGWRHRQSRRGRVTMAVGTQAQARW